MTRSYPLSYRTFYKSVSSLTGMPKENINMFMLRMTRVLINDLHRKGEVNLPYLGKFSLKRMPPRKRTVKNFVTGERTTVNIPAQDKLSFQINRKFSKLFE